VLRDPSGRATRVVFLVYDAGGHDEYQEMHQIFVTGDTLYLLVWNLAKLPRPGQSERELQRELVEQQAAWATLIQTVAPGSMVLLVGSHADEVGDDALVAQRCEHMAREVRAELERYRLTQQRELQELSAMHNLGPSTAERLRQLQRVLARPLRLAAHPLAVSAKTLSGIDRLREAMLGAAFDETAFPSFGSQQPGTYAAIHRKLLRAHPAESSLSWKEMQTAAAAQTAFDCRQLQGRFVESALTSAKAEAAAAAAAAAAAGSTIAPGGGTAQPPVPAADGEPQPAELLYSGALQCRREQRWGSAPFLPCNAELRTTGALTLQYSGDGASLGTETLELWARRFRFVCGSF
jgi:GTPase SAR1 family protein